MQSKNRFQRKTIHTNKFVIENVLPKFCLQIQKFCETKMLTVWQHSLLVNARRSFELREENRTGAKKISAVLIRARMVRVLSDNHLSFKNKKDIICFKTKNGKTKSHYLFFVSKRIMRKPKSKNGPILVFLQIPFFISHLGQTVEHWTDRRQKCKKNI